ncbi:hypothetical protein PVAND_015260 [Polypedilum vanderplanki]|uniref:Uncharacterized protein n=1 Tax=Polypedilum vanderplanki TaxID=319348 RepID=A0A9J6BBN0_POLVA|nr:hypothetical protein PVAND_015260 [Polypedilum vanderplanki]
MKTKSTVFFLLIIFSQIFFSKSAILSSEETDWIDNIIKVIKKSKSNTKLEVFDKIHKLIDDWMEDIKPGSLSRQECENEVAEAANSLNQDDVIKAVELKEFINGLIIKHEEKFAKENS